MTEEQKRIHKRALAAQVQYADCELNIIRILQDAERTKLYKAMDLPSLFQYAIDVFNFTSAVAYSYIAVTRKAIELPELMDSGLTVSALNRLVSTVDKKNVADLIHFAKTHSSRELEKELARLNPRSKPERVKVLSNECVEITAFVSNQFLDKLKRVEALRAQKNLPKGVGLALESALDEYLRKHDPVQKAERAQKRKRPMPEELCARRVLKRVPLTAAQRHAVFSRDQGKCTHVRHDGSRCNSDRWIQVHHILEVAHGGGNEPTNLTTLCSFHHDQIHQMNFRFDEVSTG